LVPESAREFAEVLAAASELLVEYEPTARQRALKTARFNLAGLPTFPDCAEGDDLEPGPAAADFGGPEVKRECNESALPS
jgi:hypothetical protein